MAQEKQDPRGIAAFMAVTGVSRETLIGLECYAQLLEQWQRSFNLVGPSTLPELWSRHFLDSWQVLQSVPDARRWVDLGSGAGFPGAVIAIAMKQLAGGFVTLVESNGKKAAFLQTVARSTGAPMAVLKARIDDVLSSFGPVDVITARALAPLDHLLRWSAPLVKAGAICLFHKGRDLEKELAEASISWDIDYEIIPSVVEDRSFLLKVTAIRPV